jgi:hypothetical protein
MTSIQILKDVIIIIIIIIMIMIMIMVMMMIMIIIIKPAIHRSITRIPVVTVRFHGTFPNETNIVVSRLCARIN